MKPVATCDGNVPDEIMFVNIVAACNAWEHPNWFGRCRGKTTAVRRPRDLYLALHGHPLKLIENNITMVSRG